MEKSTDQLHEQCSEDTEYRTGKTADNSYRPVVIIIIPALLGFIIGLLFGILYLLLKIQ